MTESIVTSSNADATSEVSIELVKGQPMTTSVDVGLHFEKLHKNVLRAIEKLECSDEFRRLNFEPALPHAPPPPPKKLSTCNRKV
ncbi:putative antirepressor [Pseudomonas syringae pv. maculicola]|nr:putative antirepressor [Pseudomonas syringae pv. maculicola]